MFDEKSRIAKAKRITTLLSKHFGSKNLKFLKVLDIGGSTGIIASYLSNFFESVVVTDIDTQAISFAKKNFKNKNLSFKVDDAMKMSFKSNTFDVVICTHVYEHVPSADILFKEIFRIMKPGGVCYLAAQNKLFPWEPHYNLLFLSLLPKKVADIYIKIFRNRNEYYEKPLSYWSLKKITKQFAVHDYTEKIVNNPNKYGYKFPIIVRPISFISTFFSPTFFWLLEKRINK